VKESRLQAIRDREKAASSGPWRHQEDDVYTYSCAVRGPDDVNVGHVSITEDATFIAHSRQDIPDLLAYIDWLESVLRDAQNDAASLSLCADHPSNKELREECVNALTRKYILERALDKVAIAYLESADNPADCRGQVYNALLEVGFMRRSAVDAK
jgi:hypothetical protein